MRDPRHRHPSWGDWLGRNAIVSPSGEIDGEEARALVETAGNLEAPVGWAGEIDP
jgi:hypothetical protein